MLWEAALAGYYQRTWKLGISNAQCSGVLAAVTGTLLVFDKLFFNSLIRALMLFEGADLAGSV